MEDALIAVTRIPTIAAISISRVLAWRHASPSPLAKGLCDGGKWVGVVGTSKRAPAHGIRCLNRMNAATSPIGSRRTEKSDVWG